MKKGKKAQHKTLIINNDWQLLLCLHRTLNVFIFLVFCAASVCFEWKTCLQVFSLFVFLFTWTMGSPLAFIYSKLYVLTK